MDDVTGVQVGETFRDFVYLKQGERGIARYPGHLQV
jgi:hypothetical protein